MSNIMSSYRSWAHALFPKLQPDEVLARINKLSGKSAVNEAMSRLRSECEIPRALLGYLPFESSTHDSVLQTLQTTTKAALDLKYEKSQNRSQESNKPRVDGENVTYDDDWSGDEDADLDLGSAEAEAIEETSALDFTDLLRMKQQVQNSDSSPNLSQSIVQFGVEDSDVVQNSILLQEAHKTTHNRFPPNAISKTGKMIVIQPSAPAPLVRSSSTASSSSVTSSQTPIDNSPTLEMDVPVDWGQDLDDIAQ